MSDDEYFTKPCKPVPCSPVLGGEPPTREAMEERVRETTYEMWRHQDRIFAVRAYIMALGEDEITPAVDQILRLVAGDDYGAWVAFYEDHGGWKRDADGNWLHPRVWPVK